MKLTDKQIVGLTKKIIKESIANLKEMPGEKYGGGISKNTLGDPIVINFLRKFNFQPFDQWYRTYDKYISGDFDPESEYWEDFEQDTLNIMSFLKKAITNTMNEADGMNSNTRMGVEFMRIVVEEITPELKKAIADLKKKDVTLKNKIYKLIGPKDKIIYNEAGNKIVIDCLGDEAGTRSKKVKEELEKHSSKVKTRKEKRLTAVDKK